MEIFIMHGPVRLFSSYLTYHVFIINIFIKRKYGSITESEFSKVLFWLPLEVLTKEVFTQWMEAVRQIVDRPVPEVWENAVMSGQITVRHHSLLDTVHHDCELYDERCKTKTHFLTPSYYVLVVGIREWGHIWWQK